jgi:hypothetical protein
MVVEQNIVPASLGAHIAEAITQGFLIKKPFEISI